MKKLLVVFVPLLALFLTACRPSFESKSNERYKAKGYDERQIDVATQYSYRWFASQANGKWVVRYGVLSLKDVETKADEMYRLLDDIQSYKLEENAKYVEYFGLRKSLEEEQIRVDAVRGRLRAARIQAEFQTLMGLVGSDSETQAQVMGYSSQKVFAERDAVKAFSLTDERIEGAKKRGILQKVEEATWKVDKTYDRKVPIDPSKDDPNAFKWEPWNVELRLVTYKIVDVARPDTNRGDYLEGYRVVNGKPESMPALRVFYPAGGKNGIIVLDTDWEGKDPAFGLADFIGQVLYASVSDVLRDDTLLKKVFEVQERHRRTPPPKDPIFVEIARIAPVDTWQASPDPKGWLVPFPYRLGKSDNYNIKLAFEGRTLADPTVATEQLKKLKAVAKEWTQAGYSYTPSMGEVVEYYHPKPDFAQKNIIRAAVLYTEDTKKVSFDFEGGRHEEGLIDPKKGNRFIEDDPFAIEFTEGQKRWRIEKSDGSAIFDKRKEVLPRRSGVTGAYGNDETY